jgi:hypothetical protein
VSDFNQERSWASWFHRLGEKAAEPAQKRAAKVRKVKANKDAAQREGGSR